MKGVNEQIKKSTGKAHIVIPGIERSRPRIKLPFVLVYKKVSVVYSQKKKMSPYKNNHLLAVFTRDNT